MNGVVEAFPVAEGRCPHCGAPTARRGWTPARCIEAARRWHERHGRAPLSTDWHRSGEYGHPTPNAVVAIFGTWTAFLDAAGLEPHRWTRDRIVEALEAYVNEHGRVPTSREWWTADPTGRRPTARMVARIFGGWNAMLRSAGHVPRKNWTRQGEAPHAVVSLVPPLPERVAAAPVAAVVNEAGLTMAQLAEHVGVNRHSLYVQLTRQRTIPYELAERLLAAVGREDAWHLELAEVA